MTDEPIEEKEDNEVEEVETDAVVNSTPSGSVSFDNSFLLKERFEINYAVPLSEYDTNGAHAYAVKDKTNPNRELFALICDQETPRLSYLAYLKSIDSPYILKLVEYGQVTYHDTEIIALIYQKPTGPKADVFTNIEDKISSETFKSLTLSLLMACDVLKTFGLTHRAIRLDNIFYKDSNKQELVLGDCLAAFPSTYQPLVYETIENTLCPSYSRGNGSIDADIYACGVV